MPEKWFVRSFTMLEISRSGRAACQGRDSTVYRPAGSATTSVSCGNATIHDRKSTQHASLVQGRSKALFGGLARPMGSRLASMPTPICTTRLSGIAQRKLIVCVPVISFQ